MAGEAVTKAPRQRKAAAASHALTVGLGVASSFRAAETAARLAALDARADQAAAAEWESIAIRAGQLAERADRAGK